MNEIVRVCLKIFTNYESIKIYFLQNPKNLRIYEINDLQGVFNFLCEVNHPNVMTGSKFRTLKFQTQKIEVSKSCSPHPSATTPFTAYNEVDRSHDQWTENHKTCPTPSQLCSNDDALNECKTTNTNQTSKFKKFSKYTCIMSIKTTF